MSEARRTAFGGWRLFSAHCRGLRHRRMSELLSIMEGNEASGSPTTYADFPHSSRYRIFYSAERNGFCRAILVPKPVGGRMAKAYVLTDAGREWLSEQRAFDAARARPPDRMPRTRRGRPRSPCDGMVPIRELDARAAARRRESVASARARMEARRAAYGRAGR